MTPVTAPLTVWRNARYTEELAFTDDVGGEDAPYDLTGWAGKLQVRLYGAAAGDPLISLSNVTSDVQGVWIIEPAAGVVRLRIDEATLTTLWSSIATIQQAEAGLAIRLRYDLVMTAPAGGDEVWMQGDFNFNPGVSV